MPNDSAKREFRGHEQYTAFSGACKRFCKEAARRREIWQRMNPVRACNVEVGHMNAQAGFDPVFPIELITYSDALTASYALAISLDDLVRQVQRSKG